MAKALAVVHIEPDVLHTQMCDSPNKAIEFANRYRKQNAAARIFVENIAKGLDPYSDEGLKELLGS